MNGDRANDIVGVQAQVVLSFALVNLSMRLVLSKLSLIYDHQFFLWGDIRPDLFV